MSECGPAARRRRHTKSSSEESRGRCSWHERAPHLHCVEWVPKNCAYHAGDGPRRGFLHASTAGSDDPGIWSAEADQLYCGVMAGKENSRRSEQQF